MNKKNKLNKTKTLKLKNQQNEMGNYNSMGRPRNRGDPNKR